MDFPDRRKKPEDFPYKKSWQKVTKCAETSLIWMVSLNFQILLLDFLYKNQDFPNFMKIMIKSDISSLYLTFCHEFFMESRWVFSYDLENSCCWQKTIQNTPIHGVPNVAQENSEIWKILYCMAFSYGSLARIPGWSAQHSNITRGDRFATRGHPWRARFCDLWKKIMDL